MDNYANEERLIEVVSQSNSTLVQELIDQGTDVNIVDEEGDNLLLVAMDTGDIDVVKALLKAGLDVNLKQDGFKTKNNGCIVELFARNKGLAPARYEIFCPQDFISEDRTLTRN